MTVPTSVVRGRLIAAVLRLAASEAHLNVVLPGPHDDAELEYATDQIDKAAAELTAHLQENPS